MPQEVALFWAVLAGFLLVDNLVLAPPGGDLLKLARHGRLRYIAATRLPWRRRDMLWLNPLNPFDLVVPTRRVAGFIALEPWRDAHRRMRQLQPALQPLAWLGVAYLLALALLLLLSWHWHFGTVLLLLLGWHLLAWVLGLVLLIRGRRPMALAPEAVVALAAEALFVPAYTLGLAKRAARRREVDLPALSLGLRELARMPAGEDRELRCWQLHSRLEAVLLDRGLEPGEAAAPATPGPWAEMARECLRRHG